MKKTLTRFICSALCIVSCFVSASCDNFSNSEAPGRQDKQTIKFLHIWPEHSNVIQKIVNDFTAVNSNIKVDIIISDYNNVGTTINTQILSQSLPDIFFYWAYGAKGYAENDVALDLTPYLDGWKDTFVGNGDISWGSAKVGDGYYAMPWRQTANIMIYNKTLFAENGWEIPETFEEFEELLKTIRAFSSSSSFSPVVTSTAGGGNLLQFYSMLGNFSNLIQESYKDPNWKSGLVKTSDTEKEYIAKMLDKVADFYAKGYLGSEGKSVETAARNFIEGNAAMIYQNFNNVDVFGEVEFDWGYFAIPGPAGLDYRYIYDSYDSLFVSKTTKNADACVKFLKYLSSKEVMQYFANATNSIVPVDITYDTARNNELASVLATMGSPLLLQENIQYSTASIQASQSELIANYIFGNSKHTSREIVNNIVEWTEYCMGEYGFSPVEPAVAFDATKNYTWLEIKK